jgi:cytidylate kinase
MNHSVASHEPGAIYHDAALNNTVSTLKKVDITHHVTGHFQNGCHTMTLAVEGRAIGSVQLNTAQTLFYLKPGYSIEQNRIYQIQQSDLLTDHYVEGCDMGWC